MAECNIDKSCFDDVKMCVKVNSVNGIKPNTDGEVDIDEKFVTTNTTQTLHGSKTFTNTIKTNGMNREAMLTTMNGLKIDTAPTVINKSSIKWNDKEQNEVSSIEVSRPANTKDTCISLSANTITEWGSNEKASVEVHAKAGATSYATAPTPSSNATGNEIVTAKWVIDKGLADDTNVVHKTGDEIIAGNKTFSNRISFPSEYFISTYTNDNSLRISRYGSGHGNVYKVIIQGDTGKLQAPNGFVGNLQGNADTATKASCLDSNVGANKIYLDWDSQVKGYVGLKVDNTVMGGIITTKDIGYQNAVHKTGNETITGAKTFTNTIYRKNTSTDLTVTPTSTQFSRLVEVADKNDKVLGYIEHAQRSGVNDLTLYVTDKNSDVHGIRVTTNNEVNPIGNNYSLGSSSGHKWKNVYSDEINTDIIGTKYIQHYGDNGFLSTLTLPKHSGKVALQERTRANAEPVNRTLLYECAGGLDKGDITLSNMYTKYNALVIVYSDDSGDYMSTYYLDCAELDIRREVAGSGTFLLVDGHSYWACTGASTGSKFVHATNNGLRIHKIYGLAEFY